PRDELRLALGDRLLARVDLLLRLRQRLRTSAEPRLLRAQLSLALLELEHLLLDDPLALAERLVLLLDRALAPGRACGEIRHTLGVLVDLGGAFGHVAVGREPELLGLNLLRERSPQLLLARQRGLQLGLDELDLVDRRLDEEVCALAGGLLRDGERACLFGF